MIKKTALLACILSPLALAAEPYPTQFEELTLTLRSSGEVQELYNETQYPINVGDVPVFRTNYGMYDIYLSNFMSIDQNYKKTAVECNINTPNQSVAPTQNVACYQVNGSPIIRVVVNSIYGDLVDASTTVNVKWVAHE